jgi:SAM-dependent methyltransferase
MDSAQGTRDQQRTLWNGPAGRAWVDAQTVLDRMFEPFEAVLAEAVPPGARVLDVGCGTGATTLALAGRAGAAGRSTGIDVSEPMIALARQRAEEGRTQADFVCGDAETHPFEPGAFDAVVSRFGVMFFGDPVRAFANLRRASRAGAALCCLAFRAAAENPFMTAAERAAAPLLPGLPPRRADGPGQFAFADGERVRGIVEGSGWTDVTLRPLDVACTFPAADLDRYLTRLGPVGLALHDADEPTRVRVATAVRAAFEPYVQGADVRFTAACWRIEARTPRGR